MKKYSNNHCLFSPKVLDKMLLVLTGRPVKASLYLEGTCKCLYHGISFSKALLRIFGEFILNKTPNRSYNSVKFTL